MPLQKRSYDCVPCGAQPGRGRLLSWVPGFLLVVLPKCPFCFMAFSSTMLLCGEGATVVSERIHQSQPTIILSALFCAIALAGILLVRRDIRTLYALLLAVAGSLMVMTSVLRGGGMALYYTGTAVIFLGVWLNTSLLYVIKKYGLLPRVLRPGRPATL